MGTAAVTDFCGQVGSTYTNLILPVSALSTISYDVPIGSAVFKDTRNPRNGITKTLNTADLACPTWGVESPNGGLLGYTAGPPFLPIIVPPPELLSFDPSWASCSYAGVENFILSYGIFDPPYALIPQVVMDPATSSHPAVSPAEPTANGPSSQDPASPGSKGVPGLPSQTVFSPATQTALLPADPKSTPPTDPGPKAPVHDSRVPPVQISSIPSPIVSLSNPAADFVHEPENTLLQTSVQYPQTSTPLDPGAGGGNQDKPMSSKTTVNLGGIIYSAFGHGNPLPTITAAGQAMTIINPSAIALDGKTLLAGADAATVSNEVMSLDPSDRLIIVTQPPQSSAGYLTPQSMFLTIAGQTVPALVGSGVIVVEGSTLTPGGPGVIISGTPVSLAQPGIVVIGISSIPLAPSPTVAIGSQVYAIQSIRNSALVVAGYTLAPGAPAVTILGTPISLALSGVLVIGTSSIARSPIAVVTIGGQTHAIDPLGPSEVVVAGKTLTAGGAGMMVSGVTVSLTPSDILIVGSSSVDIAPTTIHTIGSQSYLRGHTNPGASVSPGLTPLTATSTGSDIRIYNTWAAPFPGGSAGRGTGVWEMMVGVGFTLLMVVVL